MDLKEEITVDTVQENSTSGKRVVNIIIIIIVIENLGKIWNKIYSSRRSSTRTLEEPEEEAVEAGQDAR